MRTWWEEEKQKAWNLGKGYGDGREGNTSGQK